MMNLLPLCKLSQVFILGIEHNSKKTSSSTKRNFFKQNPGEAHLTVNKLREMVQTNTSAIFMSKVSRYAANIPGTNSY